MIPSYRLKLLTLTKSKLNFIVCCVSHRGYAVVHVYVMYVCACVQYDYMTIMTEENRNCSRESESEALSNWQFFGDNMVNATDDDMNIRER